MREGRNKSSLRTHAGRKENKTKQKKETAKANTKSPNNLFRNNFHTIIYT